MSTEEKVSSIPVSSLFDALDDIKDDSVFVKNLKDITENHEVFSYQNPGWGPSGLVKAPLKQIGVKISKKEPTSATESFKSVTKTLLGKPAKLAGKEREGFLMYITVPVGQEAKEMNDKKKASDSTPNPSSPSSPSTNLQAPITAISLLDPNKETLPYGFEAISKGIMGDKYSAELKGSGDGTLLICVERGWSGAFIKQIGLVGDDEIPILPQGAFLVSQSMGGAPGHLGGKLRFCCLQDLSNVLSAFESMGEKVQGREIGALLSRCLASGREKVILGAVNFVATSGDRIDPIVFNRVLEFLCTQGTLISSAISSTGISELLRLVGYILVKFRSRVSVTATMHVIFMCAKMYNAPASGNLQEFLYDDVVFDKVYQRLIPPLNDFKLSSRVDHKLKVHSPAARRTTAGLEGIGFANPDAHGTPLPHSPPGMLKKHPEQRAEENQANREEMEKMCRGLVTSIVTRVERELLPSPCFDSNRSWALEARMFFQTPLPTDRFFQSVARATRNIKDPKSKALVGQILAWCKIASEPTYKQHSLRRRISALKRVRDILGATAKIWGDVEDLSAILKRFVSVALAKCAAVDAHRSYSTGRPSLLKEVLKCLILITHKFKLFLAPQLGTLLEHMVLPLLTGPHVSISHKEDILSMLTRMMSTHQAAVNVYYNYDNHAEGRKLFQKILESVSKVAEGDVEVLGKKARSAETLALQVRALKLMVRLLDGLATRCDEFRDQLSTLQEKKENGRLKSKTLKNRLIDSTSSISSTGSTRPQRKNGSNISTIVSTTEMNSSEDKKSSENQGLREISIRITKTKRRATWSARQLLQAADEAVIEQAIRKFKSSSAKKALKYLRAAYPFYSTPQGFAEFLWKNQDKLDQKEIGDFLGNTGKASEEIKFFKELRRHHFKSNNFQGCSIVSGVRLILESGGFYLPGEGQKIGVIITSFAEAYNAQNPGRFVCVDDVEVLAYQIVMLNTDLHRPLRNKNDKRMTLDQLRRNLKGMSNTDEFGRNGVDFPQALLLSIFNEVKAREFKWKKVDDPNHAPDDHKLDRSEYFNNLTRKTETELAKTALVFQTYRASKSPTIAKGLYDVSWWLIAGTLGGLCKSVGTVEVLHLCIDGLKHGSRIGIRLGQETERKAFLRVLAELHFKEVTRAKEKEEKQGRQRRKGKTMAMRLANNEHERALWYRKLNMQVKRNHEKALKILHDICDETKLRIAHDKEQERLLRLQGLFGKEIILVEPARRFILNDTLTKISARNQKKEEYSFFLFSDILIYAKSQGKLYKVHQVLHLSLARVVDIMHPKTIKGTKHEHSFRIASPQKSFLISCQDGVQKARWVNAIVEAIEEVMRRRKQYLQHHLESDGDSKVSENDSSINLQVMSSWIATSEMDLFGKGDVKLVSGCKLCIRPFTMLRRKHQCTYCRDQVCLDCRTKRANVKVGKGRPVHVCDACYGFLNGLVSGTYMTGGRTVSVPILSQEEE